jgi:arginine deiminase
VTKVDADIAALKEFHAALVRFRHSQQDVIYHADLAIETTRASLAAKASQAAEYIQEPESGQERAEQIRRWQQRVEEEVSMFHTAAGRYRDLLTTDLPRSESHLLALIASLEACRT